MVKKTVIRQTNYLIFIFSITIDYKKNDGYYPDVIGETIIDVP